MKGGRQYYINQNLTIDQNLATQSYLSDQPEPNSLYSISQNMNHKMANGMKLNANEERTRDKMMSAMHDLGADYNLTRYDHAGYINGLLKQVGINASYDKLTESQLKTALVGKTFSTKQFMSTSYNDFAKAPANNPFTSRACRISIKAKSTTKGYMTGKGAGGDFGEIVLAPSSKKGNNLTVLDVKFTGKMARAKGTQSYNMRQVELVMGVK